VITSELPRTDRCMPDLLREQARARPDQVAVIHRDHRLTFRELASHSTELAGYLRDLGLGRDDCVGVFVDSSIDLLVGVWGVLSAGSAYVPLSPEYPDDRLRYIIDDARIGVIFCQHEHTSRLSELAPAGTRFVTRRDVAHFAASGPKHRIREVGTDPYPEDLAYVIYTSGSTGRPKGVMIEHRSIVNQMLWLKASRLLDDDKRVLQKTPMSFDAAQWEILAPGCGATVVVDGPGAYRDAERLIESIVTYEITTLQCVPTLLRALLATGKLHACTSLRQLFSGGEVLDTDLARQCMEVLPWCDLSNLYGPTEVTINSSVFTIGGRATSAS
jgi:non-ribosomal peptide synthetase component F